MLHPKYMNIWATAAAQPAFTLLYENKIYLFGCAVVWAVKHSEQLLLWRKTVPPVKCEVVCIPWYWKFGSVNRLSKQIANQMSALSVSQQLSVNLGLNYSFGTPGSVTHNAYNFFKDILSQRISRSFLIPVRWSSHLDQHDHGSLVLCPEKLVRYK